MAAGEDAGCYRSRREVLCSTLSGISIARGTKVVQDAAWMKPGPEKLEKRRASAEQGWCRLWRWIPEVMEVSWEG